MSKRVWLTLICLYLMTFGGVSAERGVLIVKDETGRDMPLYGGSYALLVGISDYSTGWPDLDSIPEELGRVEKLLQARGFEVVTRLDLDAQQLRDTFQTFIDKYGYYSENRLLFYFSGHGHSWAENGQGYLVASDAPRPEDPKGFPGVPFLQKTLQMSQILAWSRQMTAKHALFMFDSCFSGTLFQTRSLPERPPNISRATVLKVRQFITAGSAGETVPARSVFTPAFVDALEFGWGDLNQDGYVTGMELGLYLEGEVPKHTRPPQSPQFGKHPDYELSRGDFVFELAPGTSMKAGSQQSSVTDEISKGERPSTAESSTTQQQAEPQSQARKPSPTSDDLETGMVSIHGSCFQMGSSNNEVGRFYGERQHEVCVKDFSLGRYEVTQAQWRSLMGDDPSYFKGCDDCPVDQVSWNQVQKYLRKLNSKTGKRYRLPTDAEWEYACRGGQPDDLYCGGDVLDTLAWHSTNSGDKTHPVGSKGANGFGLYDMSGNVWEWTCSAYNQDYGGDEQGCAESSSNNLRVIRGGSWHDGSRYLRAANRGKFPPDNRKYDRGFRLAQDGLE